MPHGSGIYARRLAEALRSAAGSDGLDYWFLERGGRAPELWWEQVTLPRLLRRRRPALVHAPNCFLPLHRPCPGVVTVHDLAFEEHRDDFSRRTGWKYRTITRRAARSAERVICDSRFTRDDVCARYGVDPDRTRVVPLAPALSVGDGRRRTSCVWYALGGGCATRAWSTGSCWRGETSGSPTSCAGLRGRSRSS
jgi:glycosyltransferase involved in cell wall biosynthesis